MAITNRPKIGLISGIALAIGLSIGGGVWSAPAVAGAIAGPVIIPLMIITIIPVFLLLPAYLTLVKIKPISPGHYYYPTRLLLPNNKSVSQVIGWIVIWAQMFIVGLAIQYQVAAGASFIHGIFPILPTNIITITLIIFAFGIVWFGLRIVGVTEIILGIILLSSLFIFLIVGFLHINVDNFSPIVPTGGENALTAFALLLPTVITVVLVVDISGEIEDPESASSKQFIIGATADLLIGLLAAIVVVGVVSYTTLQGKTLAYIAQQYNNPVVTNISAIGALIAGLTTTIPSIVLINRYISAAVGDGILPDWMGKTNKHDEPIFPILIFGAEAVLTTFLNIPLGDIINAASFAILTMIFLTVFVGFRLPIQFPELFERQSLRSSRFLRPTIVRWSSLLGLVMLFSLMVKLAIDNPKGLTWYIILLISGLIIYVVQQQREQLNDYSIRSLFD